MFRIIKDYLYSLVGISASLITIFFFIGKISKDTPGSVIVGFIFLGIYGLFFFSESFYLKLIWGRNVKYSEILPLLNDAFSEIHFLDRENYNLNEAVTKFTHLCDNISRAMSLISGTNCSTTIKVLTKGIAENNNEKIKLLTFCRDKHSLATRLSHKPKYKHWLDKNTDFSYIYDNFESSNIKYFFSNQLPFLYNYQNTSFAAYKKPYQGSKWLRYFKWPLPYKSTIVVPICPHNADKVDNIVGYLCVDSPKILAFRVQYDVDLLIGIADGIYNRLLKIATDINNK